MTLSVILLFIVFVIGFIMTHVVDPITIINMEVTDKDPSEIKYMCGLYLKSLGITHIDKNISYRFVKYYRNQSIDKNSKDEQLFGTFHTWNDNYYIDISVDLPEGELLNTVKHETRHMLVTYMKEKQIIDLSQYTEEIALEETPCYNQLFNSGIKLLKKAEI